MTSAGVVPGSAGKQLDNPRGEMPGAGPCEADFMPPSSMEGILYKWTNYLSGWQPRWFLLCGGILSYYDSREDAWKGCKGSIQMAVCEIQVHATDNTRMDLAIPGEQYFYLKARTAAERQQWLVALGSAKACITDIRTKKEKEFSDSTEALKKKMSELRLYCDILVQQVNKTKDSSVLGTSESLEDLNMGALLKSTCNTFLKTLEECMKIANNTFTSRLVYATPPESPHLSALRPNKVRRSTLSSQISAQRKMELNNNIENGSFKEKTNHSDHCVTENIRVLGMDISETVPASSQEKAKSKDFRETDGDLEIIPPRTEKQGDCDLPADVKDTYADLHTKTGTLQQDEGGGNEDEGGGRELPQTFFSTMSHRFSDLVYEDEDGIPTEYFLDSCYAIVPVLEFSDSTEALKKKMSELRLYCDILVQQVNKTKDSSVLGTSESLEDLNMGALLKSTCNTFLKTLEECMKIANNTFTSRLVYATPPESPHLSALRPNKVRRSTLSSQISAQRKMELNNNIENGSFKEKTNHSDHCVTENIRVLGMDISETVPASSQEKAKSKDFRETDGDLEIIPPRTEKQGDCDLPADVKDTYADLHTKTGTLQQDEGGGNEDEGGGRELPQTFFSTMSHRFSDLVYEDEDGIPTEYFLDSCYAIVPVLDKLGPTVFAPVKMDFVGNIKKINQKYITNKEELTTLQKIVLHEVNNNLAQVRNSATEALLWLKRGLKFLFQFLTEVKNGENNIQTALSAAYGKTLRQYHGWVVRGVFALALRAAPTYDGFVAALTVKEGDEKDEYFSDAIMRDLSIYLPAMEKQLNILDTLYEERGLESEEVV